MKYIYSKGSAWFLGSFTGLAGIFFLNMNMAFGQSCPTTNTVTSVTTSPNTYFPATSASVSAGAKSIKVGSVTYGTIPISAGDILLVIQMQGAQINSTNTNAYGSGAGTGNGYLNNTNLLAGNMEFVVAANTVSLSGGTLNLVSPLVNNYKNSVYATDGQYTYQVVRVPVYYRLLLGSSITAPAWDKNSAGQFSGGVLVLYAVDSINLNSQTISASGMGFRGGGARSVGGAGGSTTLSSTDFAAFAGSSNASKGEGIAGTPRYLNINNTFYNTSFEGYPNGSFDQGAPGNAGGGGTDGNPASNNENTGGGGGGNGGTGGTGGKAWNSGKVSGGQSGGTFSQATPSHLVMGGGGGAGTTNDGTGTPGSGVASSGAAGGGIVILMANTISGPGTINVNGLDANSTVQNDGSGGGGAGGSVLIFSKTGNLSNITVTANGGKGGTNEAGGGSSHGPGGGGGGGVIFSNAILNASSSAIAGAAGFTSGGTTNYGATSGSAGTLTQTISQTQTPSFPISCSILPISFLSVTAEKQNVLAMISWQVAQEAGSQSYDVEKSLDGSRFSPIGNIPSKQNSSGANRYVYTDNIGLGSSGTLYYRIRAIDESGQYIYSKIVSIQPQVNGLAENLSVYPNPVRGSATVSFTSSKQGTVSLRLIDMRGSLTWQFQTQVNQGHTVLPIDIFGSIPEGIYILQFFDGLKQEQVKIMINH